MNNDKLQEIFKEFKLKWLNKGIELKITLEQNKKKGQYILLSAYPEYTNKHFIELLSRNYNGITLNPEFLSDMTGWEITNGRNVKCDDFLNFTQIAKEFTELTKDIKLQKGTNKTELTNVFYK